MKTFICQTSSLLTLKFLSTFKIAKCEKREKSSRKSNNKMRKGKFEEICDVMRERRVKEASIKLINKQLTSSIMLI